MKPQTPESLYLVVAFTAAIVVAAFSACAPSAEGAPADETTCRDRGQYFVDGLYGDFVGDETILVNGFPVGRSRGFAGIIAPGTGLTAPATTALVSGENTAAVSVMPLVLRTERGVTTRPVGFEVWVCEPGGHIAEGSVRSAAHVDASFAAWEADLQSRWEGWASGEDSLFAARPGLRRALADSVASGGARNGAGPALDSARAWVQRHPFVVETRFTRPAPGAGSLEPESPGASGDGAPSFDAVFRDAAVIAGSPADSARLRDYALRLQDIVTAADGEAYYAETARQLTDRYAAVHAVYGDPVPPPDSMRARRVRGVESSEWPFARGIVSFEAADVVLRSWSRGRVWELSRRGEPLLATPQENGGQSRYNVYVGEADGALRVVRLE